MSVVERVVAAARPWQFRGKVRLLSPVVPKSGTREATVFGARVRLDLADYIQRMVYLGTFEREETAAVRRLLGPGMTFLDVGANVGYFTLLAASRVGPGGRVVAVEPSPLLAPRLAETVRTNALAQVTVVAAGLGRADGRLNLYVPPAESGNHTPTMVATDGSTAVEVPVRTVDGLRAELGLTAIDLLKIDVEGYEAEVLAGATDTLATGAVRAVLLEFNDYWLQKAGSSPERLWDELIGCGFVPAHGREARPAFGPGYFSNHLFVRPERPTR